MKIAILEEDDAFRNDVQNALNGTFNYGVKCKEIAHFQDGKQLLDAVKNNYFDVIVLPREGTESDRCSEDVLLWLRRNGGERHGRYTLVIMLAHAGTLNDELYCLSLGADDYYIKPVSIHKFMLKLTKLLKLKTQAQEMKDEVLRGFERDRINQQLINDYEQQLDIYQKTRQKYIGIELVDVQDIVGHRFDYKKKQVRLPNGEEVHLPNALFKIALFILKNAGVPITKEAILEHSRVQVPSHRTLVAYISMIKKALHWDNRSEIRLHSIYGYGYKLNVKKHNENNALPEAIAC